MIAYRRFEKFEFCHIREMYTRSKVGHCISGISFFGISLEKEVVMSKSKEGDFSTAKLHLALVCSLTLNDQ